MVIVRRNREMRSSNTSKKYYPKSIIKKKVVYNRPGFWAILEQIDLEKFK